MDVNVRFDVAQDRQVDSVGRRCFPDGSSCLPYVIRELLSDHLRKIFEMLRMRIQRKQAPSWETAILIEAERRNR
jgi:hypothetical protein